MSKERIYYNIQKYLIDRLLNHNEEYHYLARPYWVYVGDGLFCAKIPADLCCLRKHTKCVFKPHVYFDVIHDRYLDYGGHVKGASILHRFYLLDYVNKREYNYTLEIDIISCLEIFKMKYQLFLTCQVIASQSVTRTAPT